MDSSAGSSIPNVEYTGSTSTQEETLVKYSKISKDDRYEKGYERHRIDYEDMEKILEEYKCKPKNDVTLLH